MPRSHRCDARAVARVAGRAIGAGDPRRALTGRRDGAAGSAVERRRKAGGRGVSSPVACARTRGGAAAPRVRQRRDPGLGRCPNPAPAFGTSLAPMWNGWGNDRSNARFQHAAAAGLTATERSAAHAQVGVCVPGRDERVEPADGRWRTRIRRQRSGRRLVARSRNRLHATGSSTPKAACAPRPPSSASANSPRGVLRRSCARGCTPLTRKPAR